MGVYKYQINCRPPYCVGKENTSGAAKIISLRVTHVLLSNTLLATVSTLLEATPAAVSVVL